MVQVDITARNYEPTKRVRLHAEQRVEKFSRYTHDLQQVRVTLTSENVAMTCEIHLHAWGRDFHVKSSSEDMLGSVDKACASMENQLRRIKAKRTDRKARFEQPGLTSAAVLEASIDRPASEEEGEVEEEEY